MRKVEDDVVRVLMVTDALGLYEYLAFRRDLSYPWYVHVFTFSRQESGL